MILSDFNSYLIAYTRKSSQKFSTVKELPQPNMMITCGYLELNLNELNLKI